MSDTPASAPLDFSPEELAEAVVHSAVPNRNPTF